MGGPLIASLKAPELSGFKLAGNVLQGQGGAAITLTTRGTLPATQYLEQLTGDMALLVLPARRPRSYPRAVKIKMTRYPRKVRASAPLPS